MKTILVTALTMGVASVSHAACLPDASEIGDAGPGSELVCDMLEAKFPQLEIAIVDRKIHSGSDVTLELVIGNRPETIDFELVGARWQPVETTIAGLN